MLFDIPAGVALSSGSLNTSSALYLAMLRSIGKLVAQALLLLAPMITLSWGVLNLFGTDTGPTDIVTVAFFTGPKQVVEMKLRVITTAAALALIIVFEVVDSYIPRRDLKEFRTIFLKQQLPTWRKPPPQPGLIEDIRINIMHIRHSWLGLLILKRLHWTWNDGFAPPNHKDANLILFTFQGVAGIAYKRQEAQAVDLRTLPPPVVHFREYSRIFILGLACMGVCVVGMWIVSVGWLFLALAGLLVVVGVVVSIKILKLHPFYLWPKQAEKTEYVKFIISVPLFRASKRESTSFKCVGIINLDTTTDRGAAFLSANVGRLVAYFDEIGQILACLR